VVITPPYRRHPTTSQTHVLGLGASCQGEATEDLCRACRRTAWWSSGGIATQSLPVSKR